MEMAYWHWMVLGIALCVLEIFLPSFTVLWFGCGALIVGVLLLVLPDASLTTQLLIWLITSCALVVIWFKYFKVLMTDKTTAGHAKEAAIGEVGQVIKAPLGDSRGVARYTTPVLGSDEWEFICDSEVVVGDRVYIKEFSGNTLIVCKLQ